MNFKLSLSFLTTFAATATAVVASAGDVDFFADSIVGSNLLSKSRRANQQYEEDLSWMTKYSIKYGSCHSVNAYGEAAGGEEEGASKFGVTHLVKYHLCPTASGGGCGNCGSGGTYVTELREFVEAYVEVQKEISESKCQDVEDSGYCGGNYYNDDEKCLASCYAKAGLSDCQNENGNEFDVAEYMECRQAEFGGNGNNNNNNGYYNNNNGYYNQAYYIGPVCSNNGIYLKLFTDAQCTKAAAKGTYEKYNYNYALPYSSKSIVDHTCISCKEQQNDNNNNNNNNNNKYYNNYQNQEPIEMCQEMYEQSAKW